MTNQKQIMRQKTAVLLLNLGGPDSLEAVQGFLYNLFSDPDIFKFPLSRFSLSRRFFASMISRRRAPHARKNYAAIGGKSPILSYTENQASALRAALKGTRAEHYDVLVAMRYWHPLINDVVRQLKRESYERVIFLPLYPQYSLTTTGSAWNEYQKACEAQGFHVDTVYIREWYREPDYQASIVQSIREQSKLFSDPDPSKIELLFSAHGLPQKIIDQGDPYASHIEATYVAVCEQLGWPHTDLSYQSRVGPLQWLKPYTEDVIKEKARQGIGQMLVYPVAFVSDHVETLHELAIEYAELAQNSGIREYRVVPALNDHPLLISALKKLVLK